MTKSQLSLRDRILHASGWTIGGYATGQVIRLVSNLLLTRLLVPEMFGVMALATMVMIGLTMFSDLGLRQSVIQSKNGNDRLWLNSAWVLQIARGCVLWMIALLISLGIYFAAKFGLMPSHSVYAQPQLPIVLAAVSFSAVIASFESTKTITAGRYLAQKALVIKDITCQIVGLAVMLLWAIVDRSIWAMVVGGLVSSVVGVMISHVLLPGIPNRFEWSRSAIHEILHFGKWVFLSSVVGFLVNNGDRMMLGGMIGARELGIYVTAFFIVSSINAVAGKLMVNVAFPVLTDAVRTRPAELKRLYYRFRRPFDWGLFFLVGLLFEAGQNIIFLLYDPRYASAGVMLEILSFSLLASRYNLADQCYMALGHPRVMTLLIAIRAVALFTLLPLAYAKYGMNGALWAIVISTFSSTPATIYYKFKFNLLELKKELEPIPMLFLGIGVGYVIQQIVFLCVRK